MIVYTALVVLQVRPLWEAQTVIPVLGMLLVRVCVCVCFVTEMVCLLLITDVCVCFTHCCVRQLCHFKG